MLTLGMTMLLQVAQPASWAHEPSTADIERAYPESAVKQFLQGAVTLSCTANAQGGMERCSIVNETPPAAGFAAAALKVSGEYRLPSGAQPAAKPIVFIVRFPLAADASSQVMRAAVPEFDGITVRLNCRYSGVHVDNCFPLFTSSRMASATEKAIGLLSQVTLPPMPHPMGRVTLPIAFVSKPGAQQGRAATPPNFLTEVDWVSRPSGRDIASLYPNHAQRLELEGYTATECTVAGDGSLTTCVTIAEEPLYEGFGAAAISLMKKFQMRSTLKGQPVAGKQVTIPVRWLLPHG